MTDSSGDKDSEVGCMVRALRHGICDDPCAFKNAESGCDCAIAADLIEKLARSSCPPADRNAVIEECANVVPSVLGFDPYFVREKIRALKSAVPECAPSINAAPGSGGQSSGRTFSQENPAGERCPVAAPSEGQTPRTDAIGPVMRTEIIGNFTAVKVEELFLLARQLEIELASVKAGDAKAILENQHLHHENIRLRDEAAADHACMLAWRKEAHRHETVACGRDCKGPGSDGCVFPRCTRYAREQNTYNTAADAVQEVAEEVAQAFRDVGLEPGEWYGDNIVVDVKRWIASDIVRLAARSSSAPVDTRMADAVRWILNDAAYKHPDQIGNVAVRWIERLREADAPLSARREHP